MDAKSFPMNWMVRVQCITYNHAPYIEDAMNGFCMQETDFPYVCVIIDDASTDGEPVVITKYLEGHFDLTDQTLTHHEETDDYVLTFTRHKTNHNCYFGVLCLKYNHWCLKKTKAPYFEKWSQAKYIAFCEGDDYWIDSHKLQKQVEYLEQNFDFGLVYTAYRNYIQKDNSFFDCDLDRDCDFEKLLLANRIQTPTTLFRNDLYKRYLKEISSTAVKRKWKMGDYPLWLYLMSNSRVKYFRIITSVYRVLDKSASHFNNYRDQLVFTTSFYNCSLFFAKRSHVQNRIKKSIIVQGLYQVIGISNAYNANSVHAALYFLKSNRIFSPKMFLWVMLRSFERGRRVSWRFESWLCH